MASKTPSKYTLQQKQEELWRRGILAPWKLHAGQKKMHEAVQASTAKKFVINSSRRLGKSWYLAVLALEQAYQYPESQIKFAAPNQKMARKIILPLMRQILSNCPKHLKPKFKTHEGVFEFSNGSELHVSGSEYGQIDSLRGQSCDLALIDEAGFMTDLEYVLEDVLMPQTITRPNARVILASTPPVSPDHPFVQRYIQQAMSNDAYARFTIYDNPLLTEDQIEEFKREAGGEDSTVWRREYLAEIVTETENALFPEASDDAIEEMVYEMPRPSHFIPITVIDLGYVDYTGILFGYYHFSEAKIVIEDEILVNKSTSADIVNRCLEKECELWGENLKPRTRIVDAQPLVIADMNQTHRFGCRAPEKSELEANVNRVRMDLHDRRIVFNPRCKSTIAQIKYGTWDDRRTKFSRSSSGGHWDLAAALVYLCKHIDRRTNPVPAGYGYNPYDHFGYPRSRPQEIKEKFKSIFPYRVRPKKAR